jgi:hypothetical protein
MTVVVTGLLVTAISAARVVGGREGFGDTPGERIEALLSSMDIAEAGEAGPSGVIDDFVYRFDGNAFPALVKQRIDSGWPTTNGQSFVSTLRVATPRFLFPDKLETSVEERNEEAYMLDHYGIDRTIDFTPTFLGTIYSYRGEALLLIFALLWGAGLALFDLWVNRAQGIFPFLAGLGMTYAVLFYEQTTDNYVITARGILVLFVFLKVVQFLERMVKNRPSPIASTEETRWRASTK